MSSKTNATGRGKASRKKASPPMGCIDIPEFLFQWLARESPIPPMALVKEERPTSLLLAINGPAREAGLRPGMRYGEALAQVPQLRGRVLSPCDRSRIQTEMVETLRAFSPVVEACPHQVGVFYTGLEGLLGLYPNWQAWARAVLRSLTQRGYWARVVVGYSRFGSMALARRQHAPPFTIVANPEEEQEKIQDVELWRLGLPLKLLQPLQQLGLERVREFLKLTSESILERFGKEAYELHRRAQGQVWDPLRPQLEPLLWEARMGLDYVEANRERLLFLIKRLLDPLLLGLYRQRRAVRRLHLQLELQDGEPLRECLQMSQPSLDSPRILDLVRLRLESMEVPRGVTDLDILLEDIECPPEQLELFEESSRRELQAAHRALDRVRAELGETAVVQACLCEGHLPTASFSWQTLERLPGTPHPGSGPSRRVRRIFLKPQRLPRPRPEQQLAGPFRLSGGWWNREILRDYFYLQGSQGEIHWAYYDGRRQAWFSEGRLE